MSIFRVLSLNTFHGLDYRNTLTMWPLEGLHRLFERRQKLLSNLEAFAADSRKENEPFLILLQELNPIATMLKKLKNRAECEGSFYRVNHGVRLGVFSYPFFLDEGLAILHSPEFHMLKHIRVPLSGRSWGFAQNEKFPLSAHLDELRGGHAMLFSFRGKNILVINVHLHHELSENGGDDRRIEELKTLFAALEKERQEADVIVLGGDFNTDTGGEELRFVLDLNYKSNAETLCTWDATKNSLAHVSTHLHLPDAPEGHSIYKRQLDYVFSKGQAEGIDYQLAFNKGSQICSDHFGLLARLKLEASANP